MKTTIFIFLICWTCSGFAQLTTNTEMTPEELVKNVLVGKGVAVSNITFSTGPLSATPIFRAMGSFNGSNSIVGLDTGVIITTGNARFSPLGPNDQEDAGRMNFAGSDPDLFMLGDSSPIFDAAILEFDFIPQTDTIEFSYVFASEEYPEWVGSEYNDIFGYFLSGPGINGPFSNSAENIAVLPGTATSIRVNTINNGLFNTGPCINCQYYINNGTGSTPALNPTTQYDGLTTVLSAVYPVQCGETYHFKFAIGDVGDGIWDSGVFIEGKILKSNAVYITATANNTVEGCDSSLLSFTRQVKFSDTLVMKFDISGTGENGIDYSFIPDSIVFYPGDTSIYFTIDPLDDDIPEETESMIITLTQTISGTCDITDTTTVWIIDKPEPIQVNVNDSIVPCNVNTVLMGLSNSSGGITPYTYYWSTGDTVSNPEINIEGASTDYYVIVGDRCGNSDTTTFNISLAEFSFTASIRPASCGEDNGMIELTPAEGVEPFSYSIDNGNNYISSPVTNLAQGTYLIMGIDSNGCRDSISVFVDMITIPVIDSIVFHSGLCFGDSSAWTAVFAHGTQIDGVLSYLWNDHLSQTTDTAHFLPQGTYLIRVTETSDSGAFSCSVTDSVIIINPVQLHCISDITHPSCANNDGIFEVILSGGTAPYQYKDELSGTISTSPIFNGLQQGFRKITVIDNNGCSYSIIDTLYAGPGPVIDNIIIMNASCGDTIKPLNTDCSIIVFASGDNYPLSFSINKGQTGSDNVFTGLAPGYHTVTIIDALGCTSSATVLISQPGKPYSTLYIPNAFTPDGDGLNDFFAPQGSNIESFEMTIYNRWGEMIYHTMEIEKPWDGKSKDRGGIEKQDVYVYQIKVKETEGETHTYLGNVTLVK